MRFKERPLKSPVSASNVKVAGVVVSDNGTMHNVNTKLMSSKIDLL